MTVVWVFESRKRSIFLKNALTAGNGGFLVSKESLEWEDCVFCISLLLRAVPRKLPLIDVSLIAVSSLV